jgi:hypothetical protein
MKWIKINITYINADNIDCFKWEDNTLYVWFVADKSPTEWNDPDMVLYNKLRRNLGIDCGLEDLCHG